MNSSNFNQIVISDSNLSEVLTSFRGPLISFPIVKSIDRNTGTLRRWVVFSQGKRPTLVRFLFGKLLWDELNTIEREVFWHLREVTKDRTIYLSLKALALGIPKKLLRERLKQLEFLGINFISRQQYLTLKGRVNWFLKEETITLRRVPKYSGYTKHYKDKGSFGPERDYVSEVLEPVHDVSDEIIFEFLTVGEISLFRGVSILPLTRTNKFETVKNESKKPTNNKQERG